MSSFGTGSFGTRAFGAGFPFAPLTAEASPSALEQRAAAQWLLREIADNVFPVDRAGNVRDLGGDPTSTPVLALPVVAGSLTGRGRVFGADIGLQGPELVAGSTRLVRDVSVHCWTTYEIAQASNGEVGTLIARGLQGSIVERILFGFEIQRVSASLMRLRARWQEADGTDATPAGISVVPPAAGQFVHLAMVRRWNTTTDSTVTYYLDGVAVGSETVSESDIGEGNGGTITIGCAGDGLGDYERFLPAGSIVDQLTVESRAMCAEEVRQEYRRLAVHWPNGRRIMRSYQPPGRAWSRKPDSAIQRVIASLGDGLGQVNAQANRIREDVMPDRAYLTALEAWERVCNLPPKPRDAIQARRDRIVGFFRAVQGYTAADIKQTLEPLLGIASAQMNLLEVSGLREDDFDSDDITTLPSNMWITRAKSGEASVATGVCTISVPSGQDRRWLSVGPGAPMRDVSLAARVWQDTAGATAVCKIHPLFTAGLVTAAIIFRRPDWGALIVGAEYNGSGYDLVSWSVAGSVATAPAVHGSAGDFVDPSWVRVHYVGGTTYQLQMSSTSKTGPWGALYTVTGPASPRWCGIATVPRITSLVAGASAEFDDFSIHEPMSPRGCAWQIYRNPALGGAYDLPAAQQQIERQKPAATHGSATDDADGFALGPSGSGLLGVHSLMPRS